MICGVPPSRVQTRPERGGVTDIVPFESTAEHVATAAPAISPATAATPALLSSARTRALKRLVDILAATTLMVAGVPLCLLVGIAIKLEDGGPILYRQLRVGRWRPFVLYKLRSMRPDAEAIGGPQWATPDDERVTRVGWWIRALRIDEIPQAWNVLRGQMSFIGPRPERPEFVSLLRREIHGYDRRLLVRPGITGWAQVNQPYAGTVADARLKLVYDIEYIERYSIWLDFRIIARTARIILLGWGQSSGKAV